ncbi:hypothetical protein AFK68_22175 [Hydrocoleum sp. CS-953]|uniref:hypothetical protein n=1 Tax=Hydrocoleum sp. CS-953 TaxID=1671698 RepID=UPI000B9B10A6|nr:hypothetical protein [Hydrocoleum sp. CS-953]OZH52766.1 hypothetical protein AFK68_22175 [Hydrocoleum sp. CS-953]
MTSNKSESQSVAPVLAMAGFTLTATLVYVGFGVASLVDQSTVVDVDAETARVEQVEEKLSALPDSE